MRLYIFVLLLLFGAFVAIEIYRPKPLDWTRTLSNKDKIPFGTELVYQLLPEQFKNQPISTVRIPVYNQIAETKLPARSTYILVDNYSRLDKNDTEKLLEYTAKGNTVFMAANEFPQKLMDTLHFKLNQVDLTDVQKNKQLQDSLAKKQSQDGSFVPEITQYLTDTLKLNFLNASLKNPNFYVLEKETGENHFVLNDTTRAVALGINQHGKYNFLKFPFGKGNIYLLSVPEVFCNYYVVHNQVDYAFKALSYLPENQPIFWDEYYKQGRIGEQSPLRFALAHEPLRWALYISVLALLLYVIFEGKRRQRIIPVVEPPQNTSLQFVETIGSLYYQRQNHTGIAHKKAIHFLAYIRNRFNLKTTDLQDEDFRETLARKSGIEPKPLAHTLQYVENVMRSTHISERELLELNREIENFYRLM